MSLPSLRAWHSRSRGPRSLSTIEFDLDQSEPGIHSPADTACDTLTPKIEIAMANKAVVSALVLVRVSAGESRDFNTSHPHEGEE